MSEVTNQRETMKPLDEITARRAAAGTDADILAAGGTPEQADAVRVALRLWFLSDVKGARTELAKAFQNGMVDRILTEFEKGAPDHHVGAER